MSLITALLGRLKVTNGGLRVTPDTIYDTPAGVAATVAGYGAAQAGQTFGYNDGSGTILEWDGANLIESVSDGGIPVDIYPNSYLVTQSDTVADPNGPFIKMRFDAAGTVALVSGNGVPHALNVVAGEYWEGTVLRINNTNTSLTNAQMVGFRRG